MFKRYVIGAVAVVALGAVVYGYGALQYRAGRSDAQTEQYINQLEQFKAQVERLDIVSSVVYQASNQLKTRLPTILADYQNETTINPLSSDCVISDGRLQYINSIIDETTSARKSSGSMPDSGKAK